jgi:hypothetical protein
MLGNSVSYRRPAMESRKRVGTSERFFDLAVWLLIATVGLVAAYVCFGILSSTAEGKYDTYSVGGAIAGALVSWGVLTSVYLQLRGSSNELEDLKERNEQLQSKLIRGAPRPGGFETEVDERQRIVLARPKVWRPKGGTIFELELPSDTSERRDTFPARFHCFCVPIDKGDGITKESFYERELKELQQASEGPSPYVHSYSSEKVRVGGELSAVECLKVIVTQFVQVEIGRSPDTGKSERNWRPITRDEFVGRLYGSVPSTLTIGKVDDLRIYSWGVRASAACYVNEQKRDWRPVDGSLLVSLRPEDVKAEATLELTFENSEAGGIRSNTVVIPVIPRTVTELALDQPVPESSTQGTKGSETTEAQVPATTDAATAQTDALVDTSTDTSTAITPPAKEVTYQLVSRMRVVCYHEPLETIYYFDFLDDVKDFVESSAVFNQVLASTRFLD